MKIQQFVMAYGAEQDRLRALLPEGFSSLRPVLRVNAEIRDGKTGCLELNTAVEKNGKRGWLNLGFWTEVPFERAAGTVTFRTALLEIAFTPVGVRGGCPAEKDNAGCFFLGNPPELRPPEVITAGHCGMQVLGFTLISNLAAGVLKQPLSEQEVLDAAAAARDRFSALILACLEAL